MRSSPFFLSNVAKLDSFLYYVCWFYQIHGAYLLEGRDNVVKGDHTLCKFHNNILHAYFEKALMKTLAQLHLKVCLQMGQLEDPVQLLLKVENIHLHDSLPLYNWYTTLVLFLSRL
jgi:hypothetical protein